MDADMVHLQCPSTCLNRGTQSKNATSCGNDWVTNITLAQSLRRMSRILKGVNCASTIHNPDAITPRWNW